MCQVKEHTPVESRSLSLFLAHSCKYFPLILSILIASFYCFWNLGCKTFGHHDESIHANVVYTMYQDGDWFTPKFAGSPYFNKPPLKMWLTVVTIKLFGPTNFAFRFWDGAAGIGTTILVFLFATQMFGSSIAGFLAALLLLSSRIYLFSHLVRHGTQDSMLVFFSTLSMLLFWRLFSILQNKAPNLSSSKLRIGGIAKQSAIIGFCVGCAVLTKSVAGLLPLIAICVIVLLDRLFFLVRLHRRPLLSDLKAAVVYVIRFLLPMVTVTLLMASAWYIPHYFMYDMDVKAVSELDRFQDGFHNSDYFTFYFYRIWLGELVQFRIWFCSFLWLIGSVIFKAKLYNEDGENVRWRKDELLLFVWGFGLLVFATILPSRVLHYIGPVIPAFAVIGAGFLYFCMREFVFTSMRDMFSLIVWAKAKIQSKLGNDPFRCSFVVLSRHYLVYLLISVTLIVKFYIYLGFGLYDNAKKILSDDKLGSHYGEIVHFVNGLENIAQAKVMFLIDATNPQTFNALAYGNMLYSQILNGEKQQTDSISIAEEFIKDSSSLPRILAVEGSYIPQIAKYQDMFTCLKFAFRGHGGKRKHGAFVINPKLEQSPSHLSPCVENN